MNKILIKILTIIYLLGFAGEVYAVILNVEKAKDHLRWNIFTTKDLIFIKKKGTVVSLKTLDVEVFQKLTRDIEKININKKYFKDVDVSNNNNNTSVLEINLTLKSKYVEVFNFYRDREKKHVIDFWIDKDNEVLEKSVKAEENKKKIISTRKMESKKGKRNKLKTKLTTNSLVPRVVENKRSVVSNIIKKRNLKSVRDFRYGAAFMWDYPAVSPQVKFEISLSRKTPEYFYKIKNRNYKKNDREAHLQLTINLYRKKKWGLMFKSMKLFEQKYQVTSDEENTIEYLKANAILKDNIMSGHAKPVKTAIAMLENIVTRTKDYNLKKGIYRYLLNYYYSEKAYIKVLKVSKSFYVDSKENFDYEESAFAAESITHSLSRLGNYEKLKEVIKDKTIKKIVPLQTLIAYELFALLKMGKEKKLIANYKKIKSSLIKPVDSSILYNVAEAFFRLGEFSESIKMYDNYILNNSHTTNSGRARVRIALAYEILGDDYKKVTNLYKNAINRTTEEAVQFEAQVRYVALTSVRKRNPTIEDKELRIFLDRGNSQTKLSKPMKKLLWQVRLRIYINDGDYDKALAYLKAIPLKGFSHSERRVYESDGAEVIYGLIQHNFTLNNSSKVVALWNNYKKKYFEKVAMDPYLNYLVGRSYIKLGFYNAFDKMLTEFNQKYNKNIIKTYPIWVERKENRNADFLLSELEIIKDIKLENWKQAEKQVRKTSKINKNNKLKFYEGVLHYKRKNYKKSIKAFESFISSRTSKERLEAEDYAEFLFSYTDSIYSLGQVSKFKRVTNALLNDFNEFNTENTYFNGIKERIRYLNLEVLASDENESSLALESKIKKYLENYKKSDYNNRIEYLLSRTLIKNKKDNEAKTLLKSLVEKEGVPVHLKEMAKSELTLLKIRKR